MSGTVVVLGSINRDLVLRCERLPAPGETVNGQELRQWTGGKGANQAVAAVRLGAKVDLIAAVGRDMNGDESMATLLEEGVGVDMVQRFEQEQTGVAVVLVDVAGRNAIALSAGANNCLRPEHLDAYRSRIEAAAVLVVQLETPLETIERAVSIAHGAGVPVVLNPAPMTTLPASLLRQVSVLVPNEHEAKLLANGFGLVGCDSIDLLGTGAKSVIVTLGERGFDLSDASGSLKLAPAKVTPVDTTGAGDTFIGALAVGLAEGGSLREATRFAQEAAAISVTRHGAMPSMPHSRELASNPSKHEEDRVT